MTIDPRNGAPKNQPTPAIKEGHRSRVEALDVTTPRGPAKNLGPVLTHLAQALAHPERGVACEHTRETHESEAVTTGGAHPLK